MTRPIDQPWVPTIDEQEDVSFYNDGADAHDAPFEPKTPCRNFETRPCVVLSLDESRRHRVEPCLPKRCVRFPAWDLGEEGSDQEL